MNYHIRSLNVGKPTTYHINEKKLRTGFIKAPVDQPIWLSKLGFEGDGQADLKNHGGEDKALLMYADHHYRYWQDYYQRHFDIPAFGENVTITGLTEEDVHIGDVFQLGEAVIQISQPRQPCYKIAEVHQLKDFPALVTETGFSGYYFRVLQEGIVSPTDELILKQTDPNAITVAYVFQTLFHHRKDRERIERLLQLETMATSLRESFLKRLGKISVND
ncbi:MOSC domain-containing protein [Aquibacillus sediminis]|uniref:MOSC domain-containing protein n=1 Tax=Aquibacillus sediminis TaxID=2574734 RepID=UPI00110884B9|nr:MOSC domain-containing protein [Aquibacillus sediminis]